MNQALIYCPNASGHRHLHACVQADVLRGCGAAVHLALGNPSPGADPAASVVVKGVLAGGGVRLEPLGDCTALDRLRGGWIPRLLELERSLKPDLTLIPMGDQARLCLAGLGAASTPRRPRRLAVFAVPRHLYVPDDRDQAWPRRCALALRRARFGFGEARYFRDEVWGDLGIDAAITLSEELARRPEGRRYRFVPEIYREWRSGAVAAQPEAIQAAEAIAEFLRDRPGGVVIPYYGLRAARRGYDLLLRLAAETPGTHLVCVGREEPGEAYRYDVPALRRALEEQGRLLEVTTPFLASANPALDLVYGSATVAVFPYRNFYVSSAAMLDAARLGVPSLTPDVGWMAARVREYRVGRTYRHRDDDAMIEAYRAMLPEAATYREAALRFAEAFSRERVEASLRAAFEPLLR